MYFQKHSLQEHAAIHMETRPHVCDVCGASFTYKSSLRSHRKTQHTECEERKFICEVDKGVIVYIYCPENASHAAVFTRSITLILYNLLQICSKAFKTRGSLEKHKVTHDLEKRIPCPRCGKLFTQTSAVTRHMVTHTGKTHTSCTQSFLCNRW